MADDAVCGPFPWPALMPEMQVAVVACMDPVTEHMLACTDRAAHGMCRRVPWYRWGTAHTLETDSLPVVQAVAAGPARFRHAWLVAANAVLRNLQFDRFTQSVIPMALAETGASMAQINLFRAGRWHAEVGLGDTLDAAAHFIGSEAAKQPHAARDIDIFYAYLAFGHVARARALLPEYLPALSLVDRSGSILGYYLYSNKPTTRQHLDSIHYGGLMHSVHASPALLGIWFPAYLGLPDAPGSPACVAYAQSVFGHVLREKPMCAMGSQWRPLVVAHPHIFGAFWQATVVSVGAHYVGLLLSMGMNPRKVIRAFRSPAHLATLIWLWSVLPAANRATRMTAHPRAHLARVRDPALAADARAWLDAEGFP